MSGGGSRRGPRRGRRWRGSLSRRRGAARDDAITELDTLDSTLATTRGELEQARTEHREELAALRREHRDELAGERHRADGALDTPRAEHQRETESLQAALTALRTAHTTHPSSRLRGTDAPMDVKGLRAVFRVGI